MSMMIRAKRSNESTENPTLSLSKLLIFALRVKRYLSSETTPGSTSSKIKFYVFFMMYNATVYRSKLLDTIGLTHIWQLSELVFKPMLEWIS